MDICQDYEELFKILNAYKIRYLVVGGQAVIFYSEPRYTKDMDVWVPPEINNVETIFNALKHFGAPLKGMTAKDFKDKKMIFQIGLPPVRIDIMGSVPGVSIKKAWEKKKRTHYGKSTIHVIDIKDLMRAKKTAGRPQDLLDYSKLMDRAKKRKKNN